MSAIHSCRSVLQTVCILTLLALVAGCIAEDKKDDNPTNSEGLEVNNTALALNGFWKGGLEQTDTIKALIYNGDVYALDADKGFFGTVESPNKEEVDFKLTAYSFSYEDTANFEFVADGTATVYTVNGLLASKTSLVGDYTTDASAFGSITLANDETYSNNSSLTALSGKWTNTDLELNITNLGRFLGFNKLTTKNCSFEGQFKIIDSNNSLLSIAINRRNCDGFNGDSNGFAAINADGKLEIYSKMGESLLFMTFSPPEKAAETPTTTPETPTTETPATETPAT